MTRSEDLIRHLPTVDLEVGDQVLVAVPADHAPADALAQGLARWTTTPDSPELNPDGEHRLVAATVATWDLYPDNTQTVHLLYTSARQGQLESRTYPFTFSADSQALVITGSVRW